MSPVAEDAIDRNILFTAVGACARIARLNLLQLCEARSTTVGGTVLYLAIPLVNAVAQCVASTPFVPVVEFAILLLA
jgi:hypothetical protein